MCADRDYRFLKEPKGVIPTILQNLLNARADVRTDIKKNEKIIENSENEDEKHKLDNLNKVLDKRQWSYKISANSVAEYMPILCKNSITEDIFFISISELSQGDWKLFTENQEVSTPKDNILIWSDLGFTKPKNVMRHVLQNQIRRVITLTGIVDCTNDHSLLDEFGSEIKPSDCNIGDKLLHMAFHGDEIKIIGHYNLESERFEEGKLFALEKNDISVPIKILNGTYDSRRSFLCGYYFHNSSLCIKGFVKVASIFFLLSSFGFKVSVIEVSYRIFQLHVSSSIKDATKIMSLNYISKIFFENKPVTVYDIETENNHFHAGIGNLIVHNSMYGAMGVIRGYLPFMPGAMCLSGDSKISFSYGFTRKIKELSDTNCLWSYNDRQIISNGNGLKYNGKRDVVKITLIDGRTLRCTPDHKIMTTNGWIEAGKLLSKHKWDGVTFTTNTEYSKVVIGFELPEDIIGEDESNWKLLDYTMDTPNNREKTLAFCRILGFILADGTISSYISQRNQKIVRSSVSIGTLLDSQIFVDDIKLLIGKEPSITNCERTEVKGNTFAVHIPKVLVDQIIMLEGIPIGKRSHQPYTLPSFILDPKCPLAVVREFLGGLFGGDGTSPSLSVAHPSFSPIQLGLTTIEKYKDDMANTMNNLVELLARFDMKFWCSIPRIARIREDIIPKDVKENPRWEYMITTNSCFSLLFAQKIGFRYCSDKNNKLTVASSYQRFSDTVREQHINLVITASNMFDLNEGKLNMKSILTKARQEVYENDFPLHEYGSLSKCTDIYNHRSRPHSLKDFRLLQKFFPTAKEYTKLVGCESWFSENKYSKKVYSFERESISAPCLYLDVVDIKYDGVDDVYDIIDVPNHSFISNGIVVHNCTTYLGRQNIELVAKTIPEKYGGELVYGDSVTGDTPIFCRYKDGTVFYRRIDAISESSSWIPYHGDKEVINMDDSVEVWTERGFTKIKKIIRHKTSKDIYRVMTKGGMVDVTEEHSLLNPNAEKITVKDIEIGTEILTIPLPDNITGLTSPMSFPIEIIYVMGIFFSAGYCCYIPNSVFASEDNEEPKSSLNNQTEWYIELPNKEMLGECGEILANKWHNPEKLPSEFRIIPVIERGTYQLIPYAKNQEMYSFFREFVLVWELLFYGSVGRKVIPDHVLLFSKDEQTAFFKGCCYGARQKDSYLANEKIRFNFSTKQGSASLFYLANNLGYNCSVDEIINDVYTIYCSRPQPLNKDDEGRRNTVIRIRNIGKSTDEYVYDLETENHHFSAGIGEIIVHNTDSNYIHFPHIQSASESWDYAVKVADEVSTLFPPPMKLEFEKTIYWRFFILTKKRYMYLACKKDGVVSGKVGKKGVLLARRDNSKFIRKLYEQMVSKIFNKEPREEVLHFILEQINKLFTNSFAYKEFVITKAVGSTNEMTLTPIVDKSGTESTKAVMIGDYKIKKLPSVSNTAGRKEEFKKKGAFDELDYYEKSLPAQVYLSVKMKKRGIVVQPGTRLEYVVTNIDNHQGKLYSKLEDIEYFQEHSDILNIDFFYYLHALIKPGDEILNIAYYKRDTGDKYFFKKDFIKEQYNFRFKTRKRVIEEIASMSRNKLVFTE